MKMPSKFEDCWITFLFCILSKLLGVGTVPLSLARNEHGFNRTPSFGHHMRQYFFLRANYTSMNHGSFGTYPKSVSTVLQKHQLISEEFPDLWLRQDVFSSLKKVRELIGSLINADSEDLVMVPNASFGINSVLRSLIFNAGERILHFSTIYPTIGKAVQFILDTNDISAVVFNVTYPMSNSEVVTKFEAFLKSVEDPSRPIKLAMMEHITAMPAVVNPIEKIIPLLKQRNISVLIDGAHALGQIAINLNELKPDYYITNCHKWFYAARGSAVLYVDKKNQGLIHPAVLGKGYRRPSDFQEEFSWIGTMDFSQYMTVPAAFEFRESIGGEKKIMQHNHNLAWEGGQLMASLLKTEIIQEKDQIGNMVDIRIPVKHPEDPMLNKEGSQNWWTEVQLKKYPETFGNVYKHAGQWWVRVSPQIYNELEDFKLLANHFLRLIDNELKE